MKCKDVDHHLNRLFARPLQRSSVFTRCVHTRGSHATCCTDDDRLAAWESRSCLSVLLGQSSRPRARPNVCAARAVGVLAACWLFACLSAHGTHARRSPCSPRVRYTELNDTEPSNCGRGPTYRIKRPGPLSTRRWRRASASHLHRARNSRRRPQRDPHASDLRSPSAR